MKQFVLAIALVVLALGASADGFPVKDGRYVGDVTVLDLTSVQIEALKVSRDLKLTKEQIARLKDATGKGPSEVYVYFTKDGESDCTCLAFNIAMRFSETQIEVPHEYVLTDEEAAKERARQEAM